MDPLTVETTIARPREEVFEYLADIANHAEFTDHFMVDWHLTSEDPYGPGAGARYKFEAPLTRFPWADSTLVELERPRRIVEVGRMGKYNRIKTYCEWTLEPAGSNGTRVTFVFESEPPLPTDKVMEALSRRRAWFKRGSRKALRRLRSILEEGRGRGARATVGGL